MTHRILVPVHTSSIKLMWTFLENFLKKKKDNRALISFFPPVKLWGLECTQINKVDWYHSDAKLLLINMSQEVKAQWYDAFSEDELFKLVVLKLSFSISIKCVCSCFYKTMYDNNLACQIPQIWCDLFGFKAKLNCLFFNPFLQGDKRFSACPACCPAGTKVS